MKLSSQLRSAIKKLVKAEDENSFKGMGDPSKYEAIELRLELAKAHVDRLLEKVDQLEPVLEETPQIVRDFAELSTAQQHLIITGKKWVNPNL